MTLSATIVYFLKNYYKQILSLLVILALGVYINSLKNEIQTLNSTITSKEEIIKQKQKTIDTYLSLGLKAKEDNKQRVIVQEKLVTKIEKEFVPQITYIETFKKDENETSCQGANRLLTSFIF
jgi:hypothetical protein